MASAARRAQWNRTSARRANNACAAPTRSCCLFSVAAQVAYFHFTEPSKQLVDGRPLAEVVKLVASATELKTIFFRRDVEPLDLDALRIKRVDFRRALLTFTNAKAWFGMKRGR